MQGFVFDTPGTLIVAILAVLLVGLAKGGLGGAMSLLGTGVLAMVLPPVQAAGILLPILVLMDGVGLWTWWGKWDKRTLRMMLPGGIVGVGIGWITAAFVSEGAVRLIVGIIALVFVLRWFLGGRGKRGPARQHHAPAASLWSALAGYTSFVAHTGGPPYQVYTMPLRMEPGIYTATSVVFFAIINAAKLVPYFALGQFDAANLTASALLMPLAVLAVLIGAAIVRRVEAAVFYPIMYTMILLVSGKLIWDGLASLW